MNAAPERSFSFWKPRENMKTIRALLGSWVHFSHVSRLRSQNWYLDKTQPLVSGRMDNLFMDAYPLLPFHWMQRQSRRENILFFKGWCLLLQVVWPGSEGSQKIKCKYRRGKAISKPRECKPLKYCPRLRSKLRQRDPECLRHMQNV